METQLTWAIGEAARQNVPLDASQDDLKYMRTHRLISYKDIRLDDSITGADLSRPGFLALNHDALRNKAYSHIFIHKRDRFARPEDAIEMVAIEKRLLLAGLTIIFSDTISEPMERGRQYPERELAMLLGYYESGAFLIKLAERVLEKQVLLAQEGFRTGGNAPYGFVRVLVDAQGNILEELPPGRRIRQAGCHVRAKPKEGVQLQTRLYILELKHQGWGFKRIAAHLNKLGIPSPDAGKTRTDHGERHLVTGTWSASTVREICMDPINIGLQEYGRRSEGAHRRLGQEGPRLLTDTDRTTPTDIDDTNQDKPRTIMNDKSVRIIRRTGGALFDEQRFEEMQRQIDERGKNQRGIPRTKNPARYPLACRIIDLTDNCGFPMYGRMHGQRPIYVCGRYWKSAGTECENNAVDGEAILRFTLKTLRQLVERHGNRDKLRDLLLQRARQDTDVLLPNLAMQEIEVLSAKAADLKQQQAIVRHRMAREKDDARYDALGEEFDVISADLQAAERELEGKQRSCPAVVERSPETEADAAMALLDDICRITSDDRARAEINPMMKKLQAWIGLNFTGAIKGKKRAVRRLLSGIMTFGDGRLPAPLYGADNRQGPQGCHGCHEPDAQCRHHADTDAGAQEPARAPSEQVNERVGGRDEMETAGTSASAPIPADSVRERPARPPLLRQVRSTCHR
ncbi:MAG: recombinase family protein [Chloroflexi bacterium]|nr:recombinase family protein [Chloroflexota bacterium]